ncbi:MAG: ribonuclease HII [Lachnospiraceae bacterium]|nr:ribonuclease HII [Candidatus Equihabitans merdae]
MTEKQLQKLREKEEKARLKLEAEMQRSKEMLTFEEKYAKVGFIAGVDEAGRGPLAGPVVAGAVILPQDHMILYLNDSKKLSAKKRDELYDIIMAEALSYGIGMASPKRIDEIGILNATYEAMQEAISKLDPQPAVLLNDAVKIPGMSIPQVPIIHGDALSGSIAAASILAKVTRDRIMEEYNELFPGYGFDGHKGYGTAAHKAALLELGPCPIHRTQFVNTFLGDKKK